MRDLLPDPGGEVTGLLALMLLTEARRPARISSRGELVTLDEQVRGAWNRDQIEEGHRLVRERLAAVSAGGPRPGRFQLLAAINAVHTDARDVRDTDWSQVVALYDRLVRIDPSPVVALNRAVAVAEVDGPDVALALVDGLPLEGCHAFHATRAALLRRLNRRDEAREAYGRAIELAAGQAGRRQGAPTGLEIQACPTDRLRAGLTPPQRAGGNGRCGSAGAARRRGR